MRAWIALVMIASLPAPVSAQVASDWTLADGCPDVERAAEVAERALSDAPAAVLRVDIERGDDGYAATLRLDGAVEAERSLADPDCAALVDACVVIAALALGIPPPQLSPPPAPGPAPPPPADPALAPDPDPSPAPDPAPDRAPEGSLRLALGGLLETSLAPVPLGLSLDVSLAWDALRVGLGARAWPSMEVSRAGGAEGASLWGLAGALHAGAGGTLAAGDAGALELSGLGRIELGVLHGDGYGVADPQSAGAATLSVGADLALVYRPLREVGVQLAAGLTVPLIRPRYLLDGAAIFRPDPAGFRLALGLVAILG